ncbi:tRNA glutamyl-Q(34) synthetase GluQRS [Chrysiogenes arsenatis]|uniref:tRNA glutamyl-Q(34) synthetase GluQRS n=1 Tax=Chrysiogenes arsenatis TaxID=309797 RepID=UPI00041A57AE|nr:tRNA glutamyl-Q(34) synthetase GluQRS [Chrysiogenes arsenatis]
MRSRLAPSPTGYLHLGNAWAFLLCYLATKAQQGTLVLRIEDLDPERSRPEYTNAIYRDLEWLGIEWDEGGAGSDPAIYQQSRRAEQYQAALQRLIASGHAYPCYCSRKELRQAAGAPHRGEYTDYPGTCRPPRDSHATENRRHAWRVKTDETMWTFCDAIHGECHYTLAQCGGDFPLQRSDGVTAYQLAVVVDDETMQIDTIVRGDDLLHSTPRQLFLQKLLGYRHPQYAHVPLLIDQTGERLAKRHASLEIQALRHQGLAASTLMGYLGWKAGLRDRREPCRAQELIAGFSWEKIPKTALTITDMNELL